MQKSKTLKITESLNKQLNEAKNPVETIKKYFDNNGTEKWNWQDPDPKLFDAMEDLASSFENKLNVDVYGLLLFMTDTNTVVAKDDERTVTAETSNGSKWTIIRSDDLKKRPHILLSMV